MNIYVSNLGYQANDEDLKSLFSAFGPVVSAKVIMDKITGRSRGFGFVEMTNEADGKTAIQNLNNQNVEGRSISVSVARERDASGNSNINRSFGSNSNSGGYKKRW
ncbi:MAG TPA: RNA-binding protein [Saprospiraceae bacterium]|nr:RNA-binding protein [Saprospiraceae bacterium]HNT19732.1 RNA-binding protein [Saprospiraceae bacterium]